LVRVTQVLDTTARARSSLTIGFSRRLVVASAVIFACLFKIWCASSEDNSKTVFLTILARRLFDRSSSNKPSGIVRVAIPGEPLLENIGASVAWGD
jgi:hypothetical protein